MLKIIVFFFAFTSSIYSQISACTDPKAENYNAAAEQNDGNCNYKNLHLKPEYSIRLSDSIKETSGLIAFENLLWTHNDDHDTTIYGLYSLGKIKKKIVLPEVINHDWEEIAQDSTHIFIGDFGNNYSGNRTDLKILKIEKKSFLEESPKIETISFTYSDQTDFSPSKPNKTDFDCEAFIVSKDSIYLFTKQWKTSKTTIYVLSKESGSQIAKLKSTLDTKGLVTGATYLENKKLIALCGYIKVGKPFLYLLYDFKDHDFLSGNKRRIDLKLPFHQIEGITTKDGLHYFLTNESLVRKPVINVPQQIHYFDLSSILGSYLHK
ncbi:T9SS C-terminal target domain-containing protein [Flavobacterium ginsenosidimutans]|uniref:T9SS C-terminal target domain-containing protein n=1 Tax=Flavobacterium ginsenosidimutans TaxID=687844 RepID=UPI000DAC7610|nr:T9SS C-terminal target domain-containing protein [Flavobacterium ginsenosidimutans]KAF2328923.1 T9SS C-terminal target domain-containing protein [Flavobacterium ginsenosidimutans]